MKYTIALLVLAVVCWAGCSSMRTYTSPIAWNGVAEGMTRQEIVTRLGLPAYQSPSQEVWRSEGWVLRVDYDPSERATTVVRLLVRQ